MEFNNYLSWHAQFFQGMQDRLELEMHQLEWKILLASIQNMHTKWEQ